MINKKVIIVFIFCLLLAGGLYYAYKNYIPTKTEYFNVSISAVYDKQRIITGFIMNGIEENTSKSYEQYFIPKGLLTIKNINLEKQNYYEEERIYNITGNKRIDLKLEKPEEVKIKKTGKNPIVLNISSKTFKDVDFCLKSSIRYLFIEPIGKIIEFVNITDGKDYSEVKYSDYKPEEWEGYSFVNIFTKEIPYEKIERLKGFEDYEKCYDGNFSLVDSYYSLSITYQDIGATSDDKIEIVLIDMKGNSHIERIK